MIGVEQEQSPLDEVEAVVPFRDAFSEALIQSVEVNPSYTFANRFNFGKYESQLIFCQIARTSILQRKWSGILR